MKLLMSEADIVREYKNAKDPKTQIEILADENLTTVTEIKKILIAAGAELPKSGIKSAKKPEKLHAAGTSTVKTTKTAPKMPEKPEKLHSEADYGEVEELEEIEEVFYPDEDILATVNSVLYGELDRLQEEIRYLEEKKAEIIKKYEKIVIFLKGAAL